MKILFDTCVVIDCLCNREIFSKEAQELFDLAHKKDVVGVVTAKSFTDLYYYIRKYTHNEEKTRTMLKKFSDSILIIDTNYKACLNALSSRIKDYEDAVMVQSAKQYEIDYIVTRNTKDYISDDVKVIEPRDMINILSKV